MNNKKELQPADPKFLPAQYNLTTSQLAKLRKDYDPGNIPKALIKGDDAYLQIHSMVMVITKVRSFIENKRKDLKSEALAWSKKVDGEAKRLREAVEVLEAPWRKIKTDLDEQEARIAEEAAAAEEARIVATEARIAELRQYADGLLSASADDIQVRIDKLSALEITEKDFDDYVDAATLVKQTILDTLTRAHTERLAFEEAAAAQIKQSETLAEQQREIEEGQRKLAEDQAKLKKLEDDERLEREKREREELAAREEAARKERNAAQAEERRLALIERIPEDQKLRKYLQDLLAVPSPVIDDPELKAVLEEVVDKLSAIGVFVLDKTQEGIRVSSNQKTG